MSFQLAVGDSILQGMCFLNIGLSSHTVAVMYYRARKFQCVGFHEKYFTILIFMNM